MSTENWVLVAKYLQAVHRGTLNPESANFQKRWTARGVTDPVPQKQQQVMALECRKSGQSKLSKEAMAGFVELLGCQLEKAESFHHFMPCVLNFVPELKSFKHEFSSLIIETARTIALGPLALPQPLLLAKEWSRGCEREVLPHRLWLYIAEFVSPGVKRWLLEDASHPLVFFRLNQFRGVMGLECVTPPGVDSRQFISRTLMDKLNIDDIHPERDWENTEVERRQLLLAQIAGMPGSLDQHVDLQLGGTLHAAGLYMRLKARVPSVLVGDFGADADIALCKIVSSMLESKLVVLDAKDGVDLSDPSFRASLAGSPLLLIRCAQADRHSVDVLQASVIEHCCGQAWTVGSLHCVHTSAIKLQQELPRRLRESVLFI